MVGVGPEPTYEEKIREPPWDQDIKKIVKSI